jgi:hypothetical protein
MGLLVISARNRLQVFVLPEDIVARCHLGTRRDLVPVRTLGGVAPMEFGFYNDSGCMAFADGCEATTALLLVTDTGISGCGTVHVIDVVRGTHVGYVAAPGTIRSPQGVATQNSLAAVSSHTSVRVFEGSGATWTSVRTITVATNIGGLRFTADGLGLVVPEYYHGGLRVFSVTAEDNSPCSDVEQLHYPLDVEEWDICPDGDGGMRAGWVVCDYRGLVAVSGTNEKAKRRGLGFYPFALAVVPGLGLLMARHDTGVQFFAAPDAVAMAAMSLCKVAWMVAVCRGLVASAATARRSHDGDDQETYRFS